MFILWHAFQINPVPYNLAFWTNIHRRTQFTYFVWKWFHLFIYIHIYFFFIFFFFNIYLFLVSFLLTYIISCLYQSIVEFGRIYAGVRWWYHDRHRHSIYGNNIYIHRKRTENSRKWDRKWQRQLKIIGISLSPKSVSQSDKSWATLLLLNLLSE